MLHAFDPGATVFSIMQILAAGTLMTLFVYYYDALWMAVLFHTGWNFTQSIVFGLPNSGIVSEYSLFRMDAVSARNGSFYNAGFGVEGSICAAIIVIAGCVLLIVINRKKHEKRDLWGSGAPAGQSAD